MRIKNRSRYACVFEAVLTGTTLIKASRQCGVGPGQVRQFVFKLARMMRNPMRLDEPMPDGELSLVELRRNSEFWLRRLKALQQEWRSGVDQTKAASSVEHKPAGFGGSIDTFELTMCAAHCLKAAGSTPAA